jgi:hypothetical protein
MANKKKVDYGALTVAALNKHQPCPPAKPPVKQPKTKK